MNVTWLVESRIIDLPLLVERMSCAPARVFKVPGGTLRRGAPADITVFDPLREWVVEPDRFRSKGRNTPYAGQRLRGVVSCTIVGGRVVYRERP